MQGEIEIGIDEAGRGPVFGPMVYAGVAWSIAGRADFCGVGFKDSKQLDADDREKLLEIIKEFEGKLLHSKYVICEPIEMTNKQLSTKKESLNTYSHNCAISIIKHFLSLGLRIKSAYLDTVGDPDKYRNLLEREFAYLKTPIGFTVCSKADDLFPVVSAASIVAKVTRDLSVKNCVFKEPIKPDREFGSGYPGDPVTKKWLDNNWAVFFGYPSSQVRFSWSTVTNRLEQKGISYEFISNESYGINTITKSLENQKDRSQANMRQRGILSSTLNLTDHDL